MPKIYKTSLIFDEKIHKRIKKYQANNDGSMKEIINNALDLFLTENEKNAGQKMNIPPVPADNKFVYAILYELEKTLAPETARVALEEACKSQNETMATMTPDKFTIEIIERLCKSIELIMNKTEAKKAEKRLLFLARGE